MTGRTRMSVTDMRGGGVNWCLRCWHWNKNEKKCYAEAGDFCKVLNDYFKKRDGNVQKLQRNMPVQTR